MKEQTDTEPRSCLRGEPVTLKLADYFTSGESSLGKKKKALNHITLLTP